MIITLYIRVMVIKIETRLSLGECLNKIKPYLKNKIINLQNYDAWKIQLTNIINFIPLKDAEEEHAMHSSSGNIKVTPYNDANEVIDELHSKYQVNLKTWIAESDFIFDLVQLMYYKCHRVNFIRGGSYIGSLGFIKKKKSNNKSKKYRRQVFSIHSNCSIKLWRNWITSRKSFKY